MVLLLWGILAVLTAPATSATIFSPSSIAVMRLGSGADPSSPGLAMPIFFDEMSNAGALIQSVRMTGTGSASCTLPAPGISNSTWIFEADGVPSASQSGISWPCYPAALGTPVSMETAKTFAVVGADMGAASYFPVITHVGIGDGSSGLRGLVTSDGADFWVVGNSRELNGLRYWPSGASSTAAVPNAGATTGQPGFAGAVAVTGGQASTSLLLFVSADAAAAGLYTVSTATGQTVSLYSSSKLLITAFLWTATADQFWEAYDNGPGQRGRIARFQLSVTKTKTNLQLNASVIDADNPIHSMWGNFSGECVQEP